MTPHPLLDATTRVALAAYLHDLGKLAERAGIHAGDPRLDAHLQLYCPYHEQGRWFSHRHAAHTALAMDTIEPHLPDLLRGDTAPFAGFRRAGDAASEGGIEATDSLINAAAAHHRPTTFLQWVIATADRVASGFEREEFEAYNQGREETATGRNHVQARQLTLFEQIRLDGAEVDNRALRARYPLAVLSPSALFPRDASECEPDRDEPARAEYAKVWRWFIEQLPSIPASHRACLPLWLDHFDSLWLSAAHAIPSATAFGVRPEVSLYDHSRTTAALAAALWRWHEHAGATGDAAADALRRRTDWDTPKLLLVQGDFFGIQDFIFAAGGQTRKGAAKLLRGRSMQVSLFTEVAALRVMEALGLPPTSQVINAAGKFLLVAPNTLQARETLETVRTELRDWFERESFGLAGIGLAWEPAACNDFLRRQGERDERTPFSRLLLRLHASLDREKHRRFDLARRGGQVFDVDFGLGPCDWNGRLPADQLETRGGQGLASCALSRDQIRIGEVIVQGLDRLLVVSDGARSELHESAALRVLEVPLFGHAVVFTRGEDVTGRFGALAASGALRRCWDFSAPAADDAQGTAPLFAGYARRFVSGYVPRVEAGEAALAQRYDGIVPDDERPAPGELETLDMLACDDRAPDSQGQWRGVAALGVLKGDVDDLGELFRTGLRQPSFAKWASLSRQVNAFFAIHLPWRLARDYPKVYTVFAGGDDFFLIGPWRSLQRLAAQLREDFRRYVAGNPSIHFSVGLCTLKAGAPIPSLAEAAEEALGQAKARGGKDAVTCFGQTVGWGDWSALESAGRRLGELRDRLDLSTGYVYALLQFIEMEQRTREQGDATAAMWRSRFAYRTRRMLLRMPLDEVARRSLQTEIVRDLGAEGIERHRGAYRIPLFNHLYQRRER
jgi:CRISPR-associated protein Csm1